MNAYRHADRTPGCLAQAHGQFVRDHVVPVPRCAEHAGPGRDAAAIVLAGKGQGGGPYVRPAAPVQADQDIITDPGCPGRDSQQAFALLREGVLSTLLAPSSPFRTSSAPSRPPPTRPPANARSHGTSQSSTE